MNVFFPTIFHSVFECCKLYVNLFLFIYPNVMSQIVNLKTQAGDFLLWLRLYSKHTNTQRHTHQAWLLLFALFLCEHIRSVRADGKWKWTMRSTVSIFGIFCSALCCFCFSIWLAVYCLHFSDFLYYIFRWARASTEWNVESQRSDLLFYIQAVITVRVVDVD